MVEPFLKVLTAADAAGRTLALRALRELAPLLHRHTLAHHLIRSRATACLGCPAEAEAAADCLVAVAAVSSECATAAFAPARELLGVAAAAARLDPPPGVLPALRQAAWGVRIVGAAGRHNFAAAPDAAAVCREVVELAPAPGGWGWSVAVEAAVAELAGLGATWPGLEVRPCDGAEGCDSAGGVSVPALLLEWAVANRRGRHTPAVEVAALRGLAVLLETSPLGAAGFAAEGGGLASLVALLPADDASASGGGGGGGVEFLALLTVLSALVRARPAALGSQLGGDLASVVGVACQRLQSRHPDPAVARLATDLLRLLRGGAAAGDAATGAAQSAAASAAAAGLAGHDSKRRRCSAAVAAGQRLPDSSADGH